MTIVAESYHPGGGFGEIEPGLIFTVRYGNDSTYYETRFTRGRNYADMEVHEMWLRPPSPPLSLSTGGGFDARQSP